MNAEFAIELLKTMIYQALIIAAPILITAMVIGSSSMIPCKGPGLRAVDMSAGGEQIAELRETRHVRTGSAIDHQIVPRDVACFVRREIGNRVGDVLRDAQVRSQRFRGDDAVQLRRQVIACRGRQHQTGRNRIAAYTPPAVRGGDGPGELHDRGFGRRIGRLTDIALQPQIRSGVDDGARTQGDHVR